MNTVINIEDISKKYIITHQPKDSYPTLADTTTQKCSYWSNRLIQPFQRTSKQDSTTQKTSEEFWALENVSFKIQQGERVGIIGRNGAGKSTLLKLLSRITEPTKGRITLEGRVASLLEVGTGFHPELTGRENIFLNGAILGMTKVEIKRNFDAIVAFAEVEKFLDTPVKRYSSGMYVRLAFAVSAHLEPEILIIDEVLAVGDTVFQKKCLDKMLEASDQGKTILFVSHNLSSIRTLCSRAILLDKGRLIYSGGVEETIDNYLGEAIVARREIDLTTIERKGSLQELIFAKITFLDYPLRFGAPIKFKLRLKSNKTKTSFHDLDFGVAIRDKNLNTIIHCSNRYLNQHFDHDCDENGYLFEIDNRLKPGGYSLVLFLREKDVVQDWLIDVLKIEIEDGNPYGFHDTKQIKGAILPDFDISLLRN